MAYISDSIIIKCNAQVFYFDTVKLKLGAYFTNESTFFLSSIFYLVFVLARHKKQNYQVQVVHDKNELKKY